MTQEEQIHKHLIEHGSITSWDCIQLYRATRLSAYILNLKKMGLDIKDKWVIDYARGKKWKVYYIDKSS